MLSVLIPIHCADDSAGYDGIRVTSVHRYDIRVWDDGPFVHHPLFKSLEGR